VAIEAEAQEGTPPTRDELRVVQVNLLRTASKELLRLSRQLLAADPKDRLARRAEKVAERLDRRRRRLSKKLGRKATAKANGGV
jgi:hypothetical protein